MSPGSTSSERVMSVELAIHRELAFRARQNDRLQPLQQQSLTELGFPTSNSSDPPPAVLDSLLRHSQLARKRLREASAKLTCSRRTSDFIPLDIAMQREMVFRRRMETGFSQCSGQVLRSFALSLPRELLSSGDLLGGEKKARPGDIACSLRHPTSAAHMPSNHQLASNQQRVRLSCNLCQVNCSNAFQLRQHYEGKPHKAKQESLKNMRMKQDQTFWCDVCQISCSGMTSMEQHRAGKKHAAQLQKR